MVFFIIWIGLMFTKMSVSRLIGTCNQCLDSNDVACLNETHFSICFKGSPTTTITQCPDNLICSDHLFICVSPAEDYTPACYHDYCGECEVTVPFTCLNETTYGYCFGDITPLESSIRSCPQGYVCNFDSPELCVPQDSNEPSCITRTTSTMEISTTPTEPTIDDTTLIPTIIPTENIATTWQSPSMTTTAPFATPKPQTAIKICREIGETGYFKSDDVTCKRYVYCYLLSGQYLGWFYNCEFYFNDVTKKCQKERPPNCVAYEY